MADTPKFKEDIRAGCETPAENQPAPRGQLIVFCGPSGVGKGTVLKKYLENNKCSALSVSATTRRPREGEIDGRDYFFISRERFGELAAKGEMLEYAEYNGNYYGTPKSAVEKKRAAGINVILEIEMQGALKIKEMGLEAVYIFLMPPSWEILRQRLTGRNTDTPENILDRLRIAQSEIEKAHLFDYVVVNDNLDECVHDIAAVIKAAGFGARFCAEFIREVLLNAQTGNVSDN